MSVTKTNSISYTSHSNFWKWVSWAGTSPSDFTRALTLTRTRTGSRLPNWKKIIESGGNATTNLTARWESIESRHMPYSHVLCHNSAGDIDCRVWGDIAVNNSRRLFFPFAPSVSTSFVDNLARAKFYKNLAMMRTRFQGLTFLGELNESLHMLRRPAAALWDSTLGYLSALRKRKRASPRYWTKSASGLWLEYSFGWLPLINDCKDAVAAWSTLTQPRPRTAKVLGSVRKEYDTSTRLNSLVWCGAGQTSLINTVIAMTCDLAFLKERVTVRYKGAIRSQVEAPQWDNWALFGFEPKQFLPTAWELLPWSFLVDYFTNIGDILSATVTDTRDLIWVNKTVIQETEGQFAAHINSDATASFIGSGTTVVIPSSQDCRAVVRRKDVTRTANSGISLPRLQFNFDLTDGQLGNIAALLGQARALHPQNIRH